MLSVVEPWGRKCTPATPISTPGVAIFNLPIYYFLPCATEHHPLRPAGKPTARLQEDMMLQTHTTTIPTRITRTCRGHARGRVRPTGTRS